MKETEITGKMRRERVRERVEWHGEVEGEGEIRGLRLPDVPPIQDFLSLHGLKLLHLILCRVEDAAKADNYEESKKKDYYQLPIPRANIHFLQTWEETLQCWEKVLQVSVTGVCRVKEQKLRSRLVRRVVCGPLPSNVSLPRSRTAASFRLV